MTDKTTYVGIDIGKKDCVICVVDRDGNVLERSKYPNKRETAAEFAKHVPMWVVFMDSRPAILLR